jgi:hypothetical protein
VEDDGRRRVTNGLPFEYETFTTRRINMRASLVAMTARVISPIYLLHAPNETISRVEEQYLDPDRSCMGILLVKSLPFFVILSVSAKAELLSPNPIPDQMT